MARVSIVLGFAETKVESKPGSWTKVPVELHYKADVLTYNKQFDSGEGVNDDIKFKNRYSIVMKDSRQAYEEIKYVRVSGQKLKMKVTALEFLRPRIIITVGGVYNGG